MMRSSPLVGIAWLVVPLPWLLGCGSPSQPGAAKTQPSVVNPPELPELGDYLPPLDRDRIEVAPPKGWHLPPRSSKYLLRVQKSRRSNYPNIVITAEDYQGEGVVTVSQDNVDKFADQRAAALEKSKSALRLAEIGEFAGIAYGKRVKVRTPVSVILDVACLETVVAGRKYCIELRSEEGSLEKDRPSLFALVGGIKFLSREPKEAPGRESGEPVKEKPEEARQADDQAKQRPKEEPKQAPKEKPKPEAKEKAKQPSKKSGELELDLDKLDELLKE